MVLTRQGLYRYTSFTNEGRPSNVLIDGLIVLTGQSFFRLTTLVLMGGEVLESFGPSSQILFRINVLVLMSGAVKDVCHGFPSSPSINNNSRQGCLSRLQFNWQECRQSTCLVTSVACRLRCSFSLEVELPSSSHAGDMVDDEMSTVGGAVGGAVGDGEGSTVEETREDEGAVEELVGVLVGAAVGRALVKRSRSG